MKVFITFLLLAGLWPTTLLADAQAGLDAFDRGEYKAAFEEFLPLAEAGDTIYQGIVGSMFHEGVGVSQDNAEALRWYRRAAEQGHAKAQFAAAAMYDSGDGVVEDDEEAVKWYRLAAEQDMARAQFVLGTKYIQGEGVPRDYEKAAKWTRLSAEQGYAGGQFNLARMYREGIGVPQDYVTAYAWANLAAAQLLIAAELRNSVLEQMTPYQLEEAQTLSRKLHEKIERRR